MTAVQSSKQFARGERKQAAHGCVVAVERPQRDASGEGNQICKPAARDVNRGQPRQPHDQLGSEDKSSLDSASQRCDRRADRFPELGASKAKRLLFVDHGDDDSEHTSRQAQQREGRRPAACS